MLFLLFCILPFSTELEGLGCSKDKRLVLDTSRMLPAIWLVLADRKQSLAETSITQVRETLFSVSGPAGKLAFPVNSRLLQAVNLSRLLAIDSDVICQIINIISLKKNPLALFLPTLSECQTHT